MDVCQLLWRWHPSWPTGGWLAGALDLVSPSCKKPQRNTKPDRGHAGTDEEPMPTHAQWSPTIIPRV